MRNEKEIREKLNQVCVKELDKKLKEFLTRAHLNCKFNIRHCVKNHGRVGFCCNPVIVSQAGVSVKVCNEESCAQKCDMYECKHTRDSVISDFHKEITDPALCGDKHPKIAALIWVLHDGQYADSGQFIEENSGSWWNRVKCWIGMAD